MISSKKFADKIIGFLQKHNTYSNHDLLVMSYGLQNFYLFITKFVVLIIISAFLNITAELIFFCLIVSLIKTTSFGVHAGSSLQCLVVSALIFLGGTYLSTIINIPVVMALVFQILTLTILFIYSPADTKKRPIVSKKRRNIYRTLTCVNCIILIIISFFIKTPFIYNCIILAPLVQAFFITPFSYFLFRQPYNNYKNVG